MRKTYFYLFILLVLSFIVLSICSSLNYDNKTEYSVTFIIDGETYKTETVEKGSYILPPEIEERDGQILKCWYKNSDYNEAWDFTNKVNGNLKLYAYWISEDKNFIQVEFSDGQQIIHKQTIELGTTANEYIPKIKEGYTYCGWLLNGKTFDFNTILNSDTTLTLQLKLEDYRVIFKVNGNIYASCTFNAENFSITEPTLPKKEHYNGSWEKYELSFNNINVNAVYEPIVYKINFWAGNKIVAVETYTIENTKHTVPKVPEIFGYKGVWQDYELNGGDINVYAEYTKIN